MILSTILSIAALFILWRCVHHARPGLKSYRDDIETCRANQFDAFIDPP